MSERWRVIQPSGIAWAVKFNTEEAAWGRLLALKNLKPDTRAHRQFLINEGWKVRISEVTSTKAEFVL